MVPARMYLRLLLYGADKLGSLLYLACILFSGRGDSHVCFSIDRPIVIIRFARKLLYLELFISCIIVMGLWDNPLTYAFLGSVFALILPMLFIKDVEDCQNTLAEQ